MITHLLPATIEFINQMRVCPVCQIGQFRIGPRGGCSVNVKCNHPGCGKEFCLGVYDNEVFTGDSLDRDAPSLYTDELLPARAPLSAEEHIVFNNTTPQPKIETLYVVIAQREGQGEGIMAMGSSPTVSLPMVFSNPDLVARMKANAVALARQQGCKAVMRVFKMVYEEEL